MGEEEFDILIGNNTEIIKSLKRLKSLEKDIIERDKAIVGYVGFIEDLKFDLKEIIKRIKEFFGD